MRLDALIDQIEASPSTSDVRTILRPVRGTKGLAAAYFERLTQIYASDPARAARLAGHWRAFLDFGDDPAIAYRAKGAADRMGGRWLSSARAFQRAGELTDDPVARWVHPIGAIDGLAKAARVDEAVGFGRQLASELDRLDRPDLAARARLNSANALLHAERGTEARALYARAIPEFARAGRTTEEAMARLGLSTTHLYGGDPEIALREAEEGRRIAESEEMDYLAALCEMNLAHVALVSGLPDEAFAALQRLRGRLEGSASDFARLEESIGDACLRLNLRDEATAAYETALSQRGALPAVDRAHVLLGLGETLAGTEPEEADRYFVRAAAGYRALGNPHWRAAALAARVNLNPQRRGAMRLADTAVAEAEGSPYHESLARLARAEALLARGGDPGHDLREVEKRLRRYGYRRLAWRIPALRARVAARPLPYYRTMFAEMMRDRLAHRSLAARMGFLQDKSEALGSYLSYLLANPTPAHVAEVREIVSQTRAATLLEEILQSGSLRLTPEQAHLLDELRVQVAQDVAEAAPDSRGSAGAVPMPVARKWTEATHVLGALDSVITPTDEGCVVLAEAGGKLWAVDDRRAMSLPISSARLEETLRWLTFEIQAPTADRDAPSAEALTLLAELRKSLVEPWDDAATSLRLCPDGALWRVPWDALLQGRTATLLLHPSLAGGVRAGAVRRVALWIDSPADLPNAPVEERTVRERFPQAETFRTRAEVLSSLGQEWDLVHVVSHARHNAGNPMFSAFSFPDGPLYATEIARSGLRTRLACLSACETGTLSHAVRAEPDGLVRAFLACGAEAVLASLWPLDDEAASIFFRTLYTHLQPDSLLSQSVGEARQSVRDWRPHPYFWASLSLFGGYRS